MEELTEGDPRQLVLENALRKARAVEGARVLGVDTAVVVDGAALGKPRDEEEAGAFLRRLSGRAHEVMSGLRAAHGRDGAHRRGGDRVCGSGRSPSATWAGTWPPANGASAPARTPSRAAEPRWWSASRAITPTWSGFPLQSLLRLCPDLLT